MSVSYADSALNPIDYRDQCQGEGQGQCGTVAERSYSPLPGVVISPRDRRMIVELDQPLSIQQIKRRTISLYRDEMPAQIIATRRRAIDSGDPEVLDQVLKKAHRPALRRLDLSRMADSDRRRCRHAVQYLIEIYYPAMLRG